jgi:hypothetical protein
MHLHSDINFSLISHAKIVGFSRLYCSIFDTTAGVATFGLLPPISPGGRSVPGELRMITKLLLFGSITLQPFIKNAHHFDDLISSILHKTFCYQDFAL